MLSDIQGAVFSSLHNIYSKGYLQFKDENHLVLILEGVMEVDELAVMEMVHDVDLFPDQSLLHGVTNWNEFCSVNVLSLQFSATMDNSEGSSSNFFKDVIMIIDTVLGFDFHRSWNVFGIDVEDKLVIVPDLTFLASDLLASFRIN